VFAFNTEAITKYFGKLTTLLFSKNKKPNTISGIGPSEWKTSELNRCY
jgi:hypothetical protein